MRLNGGAHRVVVPLLEARVTEAQILRARLREAGIETTIDNEGGADYAVGLPTSISQRTTPTA